MLCVWCVVCVLVELGVIRDVFGELSDLCSVCLTSSVCHLTSVCCVCGVWMAFYRLGLVSEDTKPI